MFTLGKPHLGKKTVKIDAPFYQAGLAGYSDAAMRLVARKHGCPYCVTEAMLDHFLINGGKALHEARLHEGDHGPDTPICGQLMGSNPDEIAQGAVILADLGYDVIDVNLACPVKKIKKKARGGHLLSAPEDAHAILDAAAQAVGDRVPLTCKLRRSYDDTLEMRKSFDSVLESAIELGFSGTTIHSRTVQQKYNGPGCWKELRDIVKRYGEHAKANNFTIGGSGDIWEVRDIFRMLEETGVSWVSVARGCIGNPWIFEQGRAWMAGDKDAALRSPTVLQQREVLLAHFKLSVDLHGEAMAGRMMRKFGIMFSRHHTQGTDVKNGFIKVRSLADWQQVLDEYYAEDGPGAAYEDTLPKEAVYVSCEEAVEELEARLG